MRLFFLIFLMLFLKQESAIAWGFYAHARINYYAVFLLPPEMAVYYKKHLPFLEEHATDPDKRRYMVPEEGPRHYIDLDRYGSYPFSELPRKYDDAVNKFGEDSLKTHGMVPWQINIMLHRLTKAFREKNWSAVLKNSAEIGHYISDAHVPLHTSSNHNGQKTNQKGIHGFWESRVPELLAETNFDFFMGKAVYIKNPEEFIWERVLESAAAVDSVLLFEKKLTEDVPSYAKYSYEERKGILIKQYASGFTINYNKMLDDMVEKRMRTSIFSVASFWYTAWVNAGQPDLSGFLKSESSTIDMKIWEALNKAWQLGREMIGRGE